jgi:hypothetical protein
LIKRRGDRGRRRRRRRRRRMGWGNPRQSVASTTETKKPGKACSS